MDASADAIEHRRQAALALQASKQTEQLEDGEEEKEEEVVVKKKVGRPPLPADARAAKEGVLQKVEGRPVGRPPCKKQLEEGEEEEEETGRHPYTNAFPT